MSNAFAGYMSETRQFETSPSEADCLKMLRQMIPLEDEEKSFQTHVTKCEQAIIERAICYIEELNSILLANQ